jgi:hypothetical protein
MTLTGITGRARAALAALTIAMCAASWLAASTAAADVVVAEDQIVQGSQCTGVDCINNESFGFATQILKENNLRILFNDTSISAGFPTENWALIANSSASGGPSYFGLADLGESGTDVSNPGTIPFQVMAGAPDKAVSIAAGGLQSARSLEQNADPAGQAEAQNVESATILNAVAALPLSTWVYQGDATGGRHIGPSGADFKAAFGLGSSEQFIAPADVGGVALASIQALKTSLDAQAAKVGDTSTAVQNLASSLGVQSTKTRRALTKIRGLQKLNRKLNRRLKRLEKAVFRR